MMEIEKLIERLKECSTYGFKQEICGDAADALSTLQAENAQLRAYLEYEREHADAYYEECGQWEAENEKLRGEVESLKKGHCAGCSIPAVKAEQIRDLTDAPKLRAELEQVKAERDAAVSWAQKFTESIDRPCVACKHNTGDYVCTAICGNCGPMGAESCKWEFDFSGELKED